MGSIADYGCSQCGRYTKDGGMCEICASRPAASEALVKHKLLANGCEVACPARENSPYDSLCKIGGVWHQVQVKTAYKTKEGVRANLCRTSRTDRTLYKPGEVDYFAVVDGKDVYMIPFSEVEGVGRINVQSQKYRKWRMA